MSDFRIASLSATNSNLAQARTDLAIKGLRNSSVQDTPTKIDKAAHEFESLLVGQWLEKAEKSFATVPGSDPDQDQDASHDQFQSIACEFLSKSLTQGGNFGIARMISKHLTETAARQAQAADNPEVTKPEVTGSDPKWQSNK